MSMLIEQDCDCDDAAIAIFSGRPLILVIMRAGISQENGVKLHHAFTR